MKSNGSFKFNVKKEQYVHTYLYNIFRWLLILSIRNSNSSKKDRAREVEGKTLMGKKQNKEIEIYT